MSEDDRRKREEMSGTVTLPDGVEEAGTEEAERLFGGLRRIGRLFTFEDWLNVLLRSRSSFEQSRDDNRKKEKK